LAECWPGRPKIHLEYLGHACFLVESDAGTRVLFDPYRPQALGGRIKLDPVNVEADIVAVTHYHEDHGWIGAVAGNPQIVDSPDESHGISFRMQTVPHDCHSGSVMGLSRMIAFTMDDTSIWHPGDLGRLPTTAECDALGPVDCLLLPMGGTYTIGPEEAVQLCQQLTPRWVVPMHYSSTRVDLDIAPRSAFVDALGQSAAVVHHTRSTLVFDAQQKNEAMEVHLLAPSR